MVRAGIEIAGALQEDRTAMVPRAWTAIDRGGPSGASKRDRTTKFGLEAQRGTQRLKAVRETAN
jgi:hypothetical protein